MYNYIPGMDDIMSDKLTKLTMTKLTMYIICYNMHNMHNMLQYAIIK